MTTDFDSKYNIVDEPTPLNTDLSGHYKQSFAYYTLRERLPVTLTSIIDNLAKDKDELANEYGENAREEIKNVVGLLSKLKYQLQTDKNLEPFTENEPDKHVWNDFIEKLPDGKNTFFETCWLYAECYMYRKVSSFFEATTALKSYDYFAKQKVNALQISIDAMETIAKYTRNVEKSADMFVRLLKLNLWGNRCDLSITSGKEVKPTEDAVEIIKSLDSNLIADNTAEICECIHTNESQQCSVDFVCDNAGYELFTDFVLGEYIIDKQLATKVRFNVKSIPWFISDVTPTDFYCTLKYLSEHNSPIISELGKKWTQLVEEGKFELSPLEHFWTSPYEFYRMSEVRPDLYKKLSESRLVIFKGDLNYRKLIGDYNWDKTESFVKCLRGFQPTNICSLRTVKADLICGLRPGVAEELFKIKPDWMTTGDYGVIQFAQGTNCNCN
ncbi:damage-control phosphatase ARMT1-like [Teleopsis dalmanni]|uniref:damage-control phosphatase ARMT1-like n=1 Tax=Teleopsis dalmanni TaxID=139649 RepID=UPI0018CE1193|nr:damage-control phosphatase ARMT1-like [Teleopsis dalmanni]